MQCHRRVARRVRLRSTQRAEVVLDLPTAGLLGLLRGRDARRDQRLGAQNRRGWYEAVPVGGGAKPSTAGGNSAATQKPAASEQQQKVRSKSANPTSGGGGVEPLRAVQARWRRKSLRGRKNS